VSLARSKRSSTNADRIPPEDRTLIERFLSELAGIPEIEAVVLFGSFARGDIDRRSDIDLLVVVDARNPGALRPRLARLITGLRPHREIRPTLTNLRDLDPTFLRNVFRDGIVLRGKLVLTPDHLALHPRILIAYDLTSLKPSQKVRFSRLIHGFESRKTVGGRTHVYRYPGLKDRYGATIVSRSALLLEPKSAEAFVRELEDHRVAYTRFDVLA